MPPKQPHHQAPTHGRKHWPAIPLQPTPDLLGHIPHPGPHPDPSTPLLPLLHRQPRQGQHHPRKDIHDNLPIHTAQPTFSPPENDIPTHQASPKRMTPPFFPLHRQPPQDQHDRLVNGGERRQVPRVLPRGFEDQAQLAAKGTRAEEEDHDEGVGKADLGAVDGAVAGAFEDGEVVCVGGVEDEGAEGFLSEELKQIEKRGEEGWE